MKKFMRICCVMAVMAVGFTSCSKEKDLPTPQQEVVASVTTPVAQPVVDMNLHVGMWNIDSIYYEDASGYNYELNQGTMNFSGSVITWDNGNSANYTLAGTLIDMPSATNYTVLSVSSNNMELESHYVAPPWDRQVYYLSK